LAHEIIWYDTKDSTDEIIGGNLGKNCGSNHNPKHCLPSTTTQEPSRRETVFRVRVTDNK